MRYTVISNLCRSFADSEKINYQLPSIMVLIALALLPTDGTGEILCPFYLLTEIHCPLCGLTRSMTAIFHLEFSRSYVLHPLGSLIFLFLLNCVIRNNPKLTFTKFEKHNKILINIFSFNFMIAMFIGVWLIRIAFR